MAGAVPQQQQQPLQPDQELEHLSATLLARPRWLVLTGAGLSTASGIPDYRDAQGQWKRPPPIQFQPFMQEAATRARYWARSMVGWRFFHGVKPNAAHRHLARLQRLGQVPLIVTQNVDGLHQQAGSTAVLDLHGRLDVVRCMDCGHRMDRADYQQALAALNPDWLHDQEGTPVAVAPDGDADLAQHDFRAFQVPGCPRCGGICKPDVVFYGEQVPRERHAQATAALHGADGLLVLGSSLMVQSSFRYAQLAVQLHKPLLIVNLGLTRADSLATQRFALPVDTALQAVLETLEAQQRRAPIASALATDCANGSAIAKPGEAVASSAPLPP